MELDLYKIYQNFLKGMKSGSLIQDYKIENKSTHHDELILDVMIQPKQTAQQIEVNILPTPNIKLMSMIIIKLEFIRQTEKAYRLPNGSWIPKSILSNIDGTPYYVVKDWWVNMAKKALHRSNDPKSIEIAGKMNGLNALKVDFDSLPQDIKMKFNKLGMKVSEKYDVNNITRMWKDTIHY